MQKTLIGVAIVIVVAFGAWFLFINNKPSPAVTGNPIKIGAILSQTGFAASFGESAKNAVQLAVEDINKSGGIDGRPVVVYYEDDHTDAKEAVSAFQKLTSIDHVDAIMGGLFDFAAQPLFPLADTNKIAFVSPDNFRIPNGFELTPNTFVTVDRATNQAQPWAPPG